MESTRMEEQSEQRSSEHQKPDTKKPSHTGLVGGLTLLSLPMVAIAAIMGLAKTLEFLDSSEKDPEQEEVTEL